MARTNITDRELEILRMRSDGETLQKIADKFSLSRERIRQIIKRANRNLVYKELPRLSKEAAIRISGTTFGPDPNENLEKVASIIEGTFKYRFPGMVSTQDRMVEGEDDGEETG